VCWEKDADVLWIGDNSTQVQIGDVLALFDCADGDCNAVTMADTEYLSGPAAQTSAASGLIFGRDGDCAESLTEGQACWDTDDDNLYVGDNAAAKLISTGGDVTDVLGCAGADCTDITMTDGDELHGPAVQDEADEGIFIGLDDDCTESLAEGQTCWKSNSDDLFIGTSSAAKLISTEGDITDVFSCTSGDCANLVIGEGESIKVIFPQNAADEGIIVGRDDNCDQSISDGQLCWDYVDDDFYVGDGAAAVKIQDWDTDLDTLATNDGSNLTSVDAATGDSATAFFDVGVIEHEYGGLEASVQAYTGLVRISGGATSDANDEAKLEAAIGSVDLVAVATDDITSANLATAVSDETGTGVVVFSTDPVLSTSVALPQAAALTVDAAGEIMVDTDDSGVGGDQLVYYDGTNAAVVPYVDQYCIRVDNVGDTETDDWPIWMNSAYTDVLLISAACACIGTCNVEADLIFEVDDGSVAAITGTTACEDTGAPPANQALSGDETNLGQFEVLRFDVNNSPDPETDEYIVCVNYEVVRQ
jgi:hypothetical protein